uniref:Inositol-tetrakisphosphate 1-kinase n=1 Tax=Canis lupus familiaris TaxID=9615 RepID=A0A8C0T3R4_CANLF
MQTFLKGKRVGYWLSEKKIKKLNFQAFAELCRKRGIEVVQLNLSRPIEEQGPLDVIIHKLTDVILEADQNDSQSLELVHRFQEYIDAHPETIVLDPLPAIRTLLDRSKSYELIRKIEAYMKDDRICSPPFMELTSLSGDDTMRLLEQNGLAFPFICKTRVAHGTNSHEMAIVFNQEGLSAIQPPCVVQNFINHNAVLYKVFVVGESYTVVQRPSLKNFSAGTSGSSPGPSLVPPVWTGSGRSGGRTVGYSGAARGLCAPLAGRMPDRESIFFNSHNVSKPESSSVLTALDKIEGVFERPSDEVIQELSRALRQALGVSLFGIDIIINNQTGQHAVIDINAFPGPERPPPSAVLAPHPMCPEEHTVSQHGRRGSQPQKLRQGPPRWGREWRLGHGSRSTLATQPSRNCPREPDARGMPGSPGEAVSRRAWVWSTRGVS